MIFLSLDGPLVIIKVGELLGLEVKMETAQEMVVGTLIIVQGQ